MVFYLAQLPPAPKTKPDSRIAELRKKGLVKLTDTWNGWGKKESGWQKQVYDFGQRAQARLDFEELALRSIDPALGPRVTSSGEGAKQVDALKGGDPLSRPSISLLYPSSFRHIVGEEALSHLESHIAERGPKHKRKFLLYAASAPLTAPFMLIPVIPNIPFFFVAWRSWSNYRASKAAEYLRTIAQEKAIIPTPSPILDEVYKHSEGVLSANSSSHSTPPASDAHPSIPSEESSIVLSELSVPLLESATPSGATFDEPLSHAHASEVIRAIRQVRTRLGLEKEIGKSPLPAKGEKPPTSAEGEKTG